MSANFTLKQRLLFGYSVPILVFVILGGVNFFSIQKRSAIEEEVVNYRTITRDINQATLGANSMVRNTRGYVLFPEISNYVDDYKKGVDLFQENATHLKEITKDPQLLEQVNKLIAGGEELQKVSGDVIQLIKEKKSAAALDLVKSMRFLALEQSRDQAIKLSDDVTKMRKDEEIALNNFILAFTILGTLSATIFALVVATLYIGKSVEGVSQAARTVAASAAEIAATVEQQERSVAQQAASVNETTTTIEELGASSRQSAQQADASAAGAKEALEIASSGLHTVEQTTEGLNNLKDKVRAIAEQIMRLSEQTGQISGVTAVVADIANQTNMLALNAAVEAARAGEQGKGFAVVASEIRKLADESKKSAERIYQLVSDVQAAMNSTVMVTDEGTKTADASIRLAQGTANAFNTVSEAINSVFLNNQQIALGSKQQAVGVQQVVSAMNAINLGSKETASGISQVKVSANDLKTVAITLQALT